MHNVAIKTHLKLARCVFRGLKSTLKCLLLGQFLAYKAILSRNLLKNIKSPLVGSKPMGIPDNISLTELTP